MIAIVAVAAGVLTLVAYLVARVEGMRRRKDAAYEERNRVVAALAFNVLNSGGRAWLAQHPMTDEDWHPLWRTIVFIDLPTGQVSWHLHDRDRPLFAGLPLGANSWDGHTTPEKYERLALCCVRK